ncbi:DNA helicase UvrD [Frankia canadensis]|uniref:DNA 3'-5' helicase n=1 Tax=Frankia canadensis TaxID=1836972 RepID=A0A2I2KJQ1_9ACTN|nr:ATP-dependent DNA helicase [Frankia canadensis]SNQ45902.1 DNA helicase UvrD [Frankia canadensis]SOU53192.1 DNA helicase UvrD [Frankia canadensis]
MPPASAPPASRGTSRAGYRLLPAPVAAPARLVADAAQRQVIEHAGGPLLVLAGPGTGKTATLVESVAARVEAGADPRSILVLTFSRRAAAELRERITARLGPAGGGRGPGAWTFHAWCLALLRAHDRPAPSGGFRLLSGPEQDARLRELIDGSREDGRPAWPPALARCLGTRGFTEEVRALLARAREVGLEPVGLAQLARRTARPEWSALAEFYEMYLDVFGFEGALDYADLVHRAAAVAGGAEAADALRTRYRHVFVDEYQDTDPAQERLLRALAGGGGDLVAFGDPDQSIYAFRGAEVAGLLDFPQRFPTADGRPAPIVALRTCRRMAPAPLLASRQVARRLPAAGLPVPALRAHRDLTGRADLGDGLVEARTYPSAGAEAEAVADLLRREHLERGTPWRAMAVLVRTAERIGRLRRALVAAGVPVSVDGDDLPVAQEPAAALLLLALRCADDPAGALTADAARTLLTSPLGGADPAGVRELGRALRAFDRDGGAIQPAASAELVRDAVADPDRLLLRVPDEVARPARRVGGLLRAGRRALRDPDGTPEQALWELWSASGWQERLVAASAGGGAAGRAADRDLDAVVALFDAVARLAQRRGRGAGAALLVDELGRQQIAAESIAPVGEDARRGGVRLLTAHRSKGLEWDVVAVCGVQDGAWPDLRERHSLLGAEELDAPARGGLRPPLTRQDLLADERRLFYVALTRARRRVLVTAVDSPDEDGSRPSRLLEELGVPVEAVLGRPPRPLTLVALVATLRRLATEPTSSPALRGAARRRLAALAAARDDAGRPLAPAAHPRTWWGLLEVTTSDVPVVAPDAPLRLSGSSLSSIGACSLRWFLEHEAHAVTVSSTAQGFGKVVHALADEVTTGRTPADLAALDARLDTVWRHLDYEARWRSEQERGAAREALARFLDWHAAERGRRVAGAEVSFTARLTVAGRDVLLRGFIDRLELDGEGRVHVIDFKTGRTAPSRAELAVHPQLGSYQLAVRAGALDSALDSALAAARTPDGTPAGPGGAQPAEPGGAELVQLRLDTGGDNRAPRLPGEAPGPPQVQAQEPLPATGETWMDQAIGEAVRVVDAEAFRPTPGDQCPVCTFQASCPARPEGRQVVE